ncbi:GDSL-type esterase/lipase family protein [Dactylosporangium roseum]|uniref:GDSL-type esterase/lipase family protein n=1 Tax=Dactylosporangium roseum TaxID=47989 RepID=UPI0021B29647|nr:GDSL-type esterase/lipase family protein [Dactylosporangium roseum]
MTSEDGKRHGVDAGIPGGVAPPDGGRPARRHGPGAVLREARSLPTVLLLAVCLLVGVPATIGLTPAQELTVAGQTLSVGARVPSLSVSGPARLVQIGNTRLDIAPLRVYGPLRPQVTLGPIQRNPAAAATVDPASGAQARAAAVSTVSTGFLQWYCWATLGLFAFTLAAAAVAAYLRILVILRRQSRARHRQVTAAELWHSGAGQFRRMASIAVAVTMVCWAGAGALAYSGTVQGLQSVRSLADLVGTHHLSPLAVGPKVTGYTGAVIGDSRAARVGGAPVAGATPDDTACGRSADSLAAEIGMTRGQRVLNLACSGASVPRGLLGPQAQGGRTLPSQVGLLQQMRGLKYVAVVIGPNDLYWADFLQYCYAVADCQDRFTQGEFDYRLATFDRDYGELLHHLNDLPGRPQIVVVTSYDVFNADATCSDARGPAGVSGLNPSNITLLSGRNKALNDVLVSGARKYGFSVASPRLAPLCTDSADRLGADIQGLDGTHPFHPTGIGSMRLASAVVQAIRADTGT